MIGLIKPCFLLIERGLFKSWIEDFGGSLAQKSLLGCRWIRVNKFFEIIFGGPISLLPYIEPKHLYNYL